MNEVSITINGVTYDAVETKTEFTCEECDMLHLCEKKQFMSLCLILNVKENKCFKKSDKKLRNENPTLATEIKVVRND